MRRAITLVFLSALVVNAGPIIFSNLDSADPLFQTASGVFFGESIGITRIANGFVLEDTYTLSSIEVAISRLTEEGVLFLTLAADNGFQPGAAIETFDLSGLMASFGEATTPVLALSTLRPQLEQGVLYWVVAELGSNTIGVWHSTNAFDVGPHAFQFSPDSWTASLDARDAFRVTAAEVPEPSSLALVISGVALIVAIGRRARRLP